MTDYTPIAAGKVLHLLYRKEMAYTIQSLFCKADYRHVSVQRLNSSQDSSILMMVLEAVKSAGYKNNDIHK